MNTDSRPDSAATLQTISASPGVRLMSAVAPKSEAVCSEPIRSLLTSAPPHRSQHVISARERNCSCISLSVIYMLEGQEDAPFNFNAFDVCNKEKIYNDEFPAYPHYIVCVSFSLLSAKCRISNWSPQIPPDFYNLLAGVWRFLKTSHTQC